MWSTSSDVSTSGAAILVNGSRQALRVGDAFGPQIVEAARNAGLGKFRVILNGEEVLQEAAPSVVNSGDVVELRPYDVAG